MEAQLNWKVVYVSSRREKKAHDALRAKGIEVYLPISRQLRQWSDRKKWVDFPMFSGYLFVRPTEFQRDSVLQIPGILQYLRFEDRDACVREDEIEMIRNIENSGYSAMATDSYPDIEEGEEVRITEGPLRGQKVRVVKRKNKSEVLVLLDSIHQAVHVDLPIRILENIRN